MELVVRLVVVVVRGVAVRVQVMVGLRHRRLRRAPPLVLVAFKLVAVPQADAHGGDERRHDERDRDPEPDAEVVPAAAGPALPAEVKPARHGGPREHPHAEPQGQHRDGVLVHPVRVRAEAALHHAPREVDGEGDGAPDVDDAEDEPSAADARALARLRCCDGEEGREGTHDEEDAHEHPKDGREEGQEKQVTRVKREARAQMAVTVRTLEVAAGAQVADAVVRAAARPCGLAAAAGAASRHRAVGAA
mmetsp:Transcript_41230/g.127329  ORF Transcript_41230/g.127329 Transcript_41230/m.127329 type:complete len:248 (-) Transcript_41230:226-969(-)